MGKGKAVGMAFIGCGNISGPYAESVLAHPEELRLVGAYDLVRERAESFARKYGCAAFGSMEQALSSDDVELVVNLTIHTAHAQVTKRALEAGKHVHSEKPLATSREDGKALVDLASKKKLLLGCSPFVILGEAQQTLWKAVRDGTVGRVLYASADMMHGRIESWHPSPEAFYAPGAGPMLDVGCYPLNVLTSILGPVRSVRGQAKTLIPKREIGSGPKKGKAFDVTTPDHVDGILEFSNGAMGRLSASFVVEKSAHTGIEITGSSGTLRADSPVDFDSPVLFCPIGKRDWSTIPLLAKPYRGVEWSRGLLDIADAIKKGRQPRCSGEQANHILDVCLSILEASELGREVRLSTTFKAPEPVYK
ncbi:MAG: Gfo/Idh/MocA family oxidoreductase [Candidatus Brockarchaeota archaeon]|nr:Gfo/Idh/MocA family oxidoreductase [Candidatus Brockarchaeota archaeon]